MKNPRFERLGRMQRQYHRNNQWRLSQGGLFIPHLYDETRTDGLSWWDDVGFILNDRRVIVWWQHPRSVYSDRIQDVSWDIAGEGPKDDWLTDGATANYKKVGKSRKKIVGFTSHRPSEEQQQFYDKLSDIQERLAVDGIDYDVQPSWHRERLTWATGVALVVPLEVRNERELAVVASLAKQLILGQTSLQAEFPDYRYTKADWLREKGLRISD